LVRKAADDRRAAARQVARTVSVPAPIGGWDAQSALADMPEENAVYLINYIPRPAYVELRRGSYGQIGSLGQGTPHTLMTWSGVTDKLLACAGTSIYDATVQGALNPAPIYAGATVDTWESTNFANSGGTYLIAVNGTDTPIKYDGTTVTTTAFTGTSGPITLNPNNLDLIMQHQRRLHMGEKGTLRVWFPLSVDDIAGACGLLDLGPVFSKGGTLAAIGTTSWTYSLSPDDFAVYVTTQGQVAVYQGTDPSDATNWSLVGVYSLGYPMGPRSLIKYGSDLAVVTTDGVIPLSQAMKLDRSQDDAIALTQKIQGAFQTATATYPQGTPGWQGILYPKGGLAIINVPSSPAVQYVQNVQTGAWCSFTGLNATCWAIANNTAYFGAPGGVYQWDTGASDSETEITYDLKCAFSDYRSKGQKRFTMLRTLMNTVPWITPAVEVDVDYQDSIPTATPTVVNTGALTPAARYTWSSASGTGFVGAVRMRVVLNTQTALAIDSADVDELVTGDGYALITGDPLTAIPFQLTSFDVLYEPGGIL
jgi:hypothetical protein